MTITAMSFETRLPISASRRNQSKRIGASIAIAGLVTFGLFMAMRWLIATEFIPVTIEPVRDVVVLVAMEEGDPDIKRTDRVPPPSLLAPPPSLPPLTGPITGVILPILTFEGAVPDLDNIDTGAVFETKTIVIDGRSVTPLAPPIVTYPEAALRRGIQGHCDVSMDVTARGKPFNVTANCSDRVFEKEAVRAVSRVEFLPMIFEGRSVERKNVVYPLEFKLEG